MARHSLNLTVEKILLFVHFCIVVKNGLIRRLFQDVVTQRVEDHSRILSSITLSFLQLIVLPRLHALHHKLALHVARDQ